MANQVDIARLAKVSQSVVSRVLTGRAKDFGIAEETIDRVRLIAEALNYQPNQAAHMLLGRGTKLVGVIVRSFEDQFLATILEELNTRALRAGYTLLVVGFESGEFNAQEIRLLQSYRPDAFVVVGTTDFRGWDEAFLNAGKTIIQIGQPVADARLISCGTDEVEAARQLVEHLVDLGHRRIGIAGDCTTSSHVRQMRIKDAMRERGLSFSLPHCYLSEQASVAAGRDAAMHFVQDENFANWPTAVIATGDLIALSFIRALGERGIEVPGFLSVASYNDIMPASLTQPSLTTIRQPARELAGASMDIVTGGAERVSILLAPTLQIRESTAPVRAV